ncbi:thermonuclease family protein [Sphingomonas xanthus]|uniref:Thermonuclease family protein n=1 Tax=Sphingomonas xanthus TaxID=2594473 RepID=A0A516IU51_9SPHN|nr:thermonuclease family protein [Sphingomonas xanthus]QDP20433.1 thermonuclease family protein [Sphingomonas xanthus]
MLNQLLFAAMIAAASNGVDPVVGTATAGDGDSLDIGDVRVRLFGIDAPELSQTCQKGGQSWDCGRDAKDRLASLVQGREVRCVPTGFDVHGRTIARCSAGGVDLNRAMVASGYALAFRRYSHDYVSAEQSAKLGKKGLWAGTFQAPSEVRAEQGVGRASGRGTKAAGSSARSQSQRRPMAALSSSRGCNIKGNHSRKGEFIYHLPGMPYYAQTRAEAMFCSEAEARAAGYRRAKVR